MAKKLPVFFHQEQLMHKPLYEYAFGEKIAHPETTHRAQSILNSIEGEPDLFALFAPENFPLKEIRAIHNHKLVRVLQAASSLNPATTFYPCVFPYYRDKSRLDPSNINHAGAFCFDNGTPLNSTTYAAAAWSAADAVMAAQFVAEEKARVAYALCRPPGHHASRDLFGGYCYFNNAALAAQQLRAVYQRVAILDIDFHHGNGTQVIFDRDPHVHVTSIHGDPNKFYPWFTGFETEIGSGAGKGFNLNVALDRGVDGQAYLEALARALKVIKEFAPEVLIVSAGFDTYVADPIGGFTLETNDYATIGSAIAQLKVPTLIVQEGGYEELSLGRNVTTFLKPFLEYL